MISFCIYFDQTRQGGSENENVDVVFSGLLVVPKKWERNSYPCANEKDTFRVARTRSIVGMKPC